jgi:cation transport regulator ChaB
MGLEKARGLNPLISWLWEMVSIFGTDEITIPIDFHTQVYKMEETLRSDTSGLVNSLLDFAINCALVNYRIETENKSFTNLLNGFLEDVNSEFRGKLPTGINALAREYFRERWKRSSLIILRTEWEEKDGYNLPTKLWFVNGRNVYVKDKTKDVRIIGEEKYYLKIKQNSDDLKLIPSRNNEKIFVQKPFSPWDSLYPIPFGIQRGLYKNLSLMNLMNTKGEKIISKAIEYLFSTKKGTEALALSGNPNFIYSEDDLKVLKDSFKTFVDDNKTNSGTSAYFSNFDTDMEHIIPDYSKALNASLYAPIERRLLAALGLIEVVEGITSNRREGILNPKPFIAEIKAGVSDFADLLKDLFKTIAEENSNHKKYFSKKIKVYPSTIDDFLDDSIRNHLRSMYDRGCLSKQTYTEVVGAGYADFDVEVNRRKLEYKDGVEDIMYPHLITNQENVPDEREVPGVPLKKKENIEEIPDDKKSIEKINYKGEEYDGSDTEFLEAIEEFADTYEEAPYKRNMDLPEAVKKYSRKAQSIFRKTFNEVLKKDNDEKKAFKVAWNALKLFLKNKEE